MRVGLLECDHVRPELLHIAGDYREMFPALFKDVAPEWEFHFFDVCNGHFPESATACDLYICTGSKSSVYDDELWITELKAFVSRVRDADKYFIGICFGHQMLGEALGGKVAKSEFGWNVGVHAFEIIQTENWMQPAQEQLHLLMMCQDQVEVLPPGSTLLARTPVCPAAMFRVGDKMLGVQAHPEFSADYDRALMELRVERIGAEKVAAGIESLQTAQDGKLFAQWVRAFVGL